MTKRLMLIRHAESTANAGEKSTTDAIGIPLTALGIEQSAKLANDLNIRPDHIFVSKHLRARQTAEPILEKYHDVPTTEAEIEEFTYLDQEKILGYRKPERRHFAIEYWERGDVNYVDGDGLESFSSFYQRGMRFLDQVRNTEGSFFIAVSHAFFIGLIEEIMKGNHDMSLAMANMGQKMKELSFLENCEFIEFEIPVDKDI